jgi:catechol 2,3-dioxygenase-like lactoylglutathione lyase family enzyme
MDQPHAWSFAATIPAKDLEGTRKFYEDVLGCEVVREAPSGITYRSGDSFFDLYPTQFAGTAQHTLGGFYVEDIDTAVDDLAAKGVTFEQYDFPGLKTNDKGIADLGGELGAWFKDPEGNILVLGQRTEA